MPLKTPAHWADNNPVAIALYPLSLLFRAVAALRRMLYKAKLKRTWRAAVPVVIVGNITAGGAGKTPLVIALVELLQSLDYRVGVSVRGYGGKGSLPDGEMVTAVSDPLLVGDEAVLIARRTKAPTIVGRNRPRAIEKLLSLQPVDIVVCDDGMQHYALERDIEIMVVDNDSGFGNGLFMPSGPLREPIGRMQQADLLVYSGDNRQHTGYTLHVDAVVKVDNPAQTTALAAFAEQPVHAVAGLAHPGKFFRLLRNAGVRPIEHSFADHYRYSPTDLVFDDDYAILMTEKDAVKLCNHSHQNAWYVKVTAHLDKALIDSFKALLNHVHVQRKS